MKKGLVPDVQGICRVRRRNCDGELFGNDMGRKEADGEVPQDLCTLSYLQDGYQRAVRSGREYKKED